MENSKLLSHLRTFSREEGRDFHRWLLSPVHNRSGKLAPFFEYLRKSAPQYHGRRLKIENVHKFLYRDLPFKEIRIQQLMTEMLQQLYDFWIYQRQKASPIERQMTLWKELSRRNLKLYAESVQKDIEKLLDSSAYESDRYNYAHFEFAREEHELIFALGQRDREPKLQEVSDSLDHFYYYQKLKFYCSSLMLARFSKIEYNFALITEILEKVDEANYSHHYGIQYYRHAVYALLDKGDEHFFAMKALLQEQLLGEAAEDLQAMLLAARNYCIKKLNSNRREFLEELYELYQLEIKQGLIYVNGKIPAATYKNISTTAILLKRFDWLEQFLTDNQQAVSPGSYHFNVAILRFSQGRYEEVVNLFEKADYDEVLLNLSAKAWLLKTYYELSLQQPENDQYEDRLEAHITAFTAFLNRKRRSLPEHYLYYLNLARFSREMIRHSRPYNFDAEQLKSTLDKVLSIREVAEKGWLKRKIQALLLSE